MREWEVWFAEFPFEEDATVVKKRPVIVLNVETLEVLSIKVTSHDVRNQDQFDTPIVYWKEAGLNRESIARVSKTIRLTNDKFIHRIGDLHIADQNSIAKQFVAYITSLK